jgi:hypothetical protein
LNLIPQFIVTNLRHSKLLLVTQHEKRYFSKSSKYISRAFRYRNLYFFKDKMYYEFDDISNTLVKSGKFDLTVFGFKCGLIDQIIKLIIRL